MRRYAVTEAPRALLAHELGELIRREQHLNPDRPERAESYRRALTEIEMGAPVARARHTEFRVNEECSSRYGVTEGSATEILEALESYRADRRQQGKAKKVQEFARGIRAIESGEWEVRVQHVVYRVVEDRKSAYRVVEG